MTVKVDDLAWQAAWRDLQALRRPDGTVAPSIRRAIAARLRISDRQLRRRLSKPRLTEVAPSLTAEQLAYVAAYGIPAIAYRRLVDDGLFSGSLATFYRRLRAVGLSIRRAVIAGDEAMRETFAYLRWEADSVDEVWQQDTFWSRITVLDGRSPVQPVIELIVDDRSRHMMGIQVSVRPPDAELAATTVAAALEGQLTPSGAPCKPKRLRYDQARSYTGEHFTEALAMAEIEPDGVVGYSPHLKGKVERAIRTLRSEYLRGLPGSHEGPRALGEDGSEPDPRDHLLTLDEFRARVLAAARHYNTERPHRALGGRTPAEVYAEGSRPRVVSELGLRSLLRRPSQTRRTSKNGIRWNGGDYTAPDLRAGVDVDVAPHPTDPTRLEVYRDGIWWCTARPHAFWRDQAHLFYAKRKADEKVAHRIHRKASELRSRDVPSPAERDDADQDQLYDELLDDDGASEQSA